MRSESVDVHILHDSCVITQNDGSEIAVMPLLLQIVRKLSIIPALAIDGL